MIRPVLPHAVEQQLGVQISEERLDAFHHLGIFRTREPVQRIVEAVDEGLNRVGFDSMKSGIAANEL